VLDTVRSFYELADQLLLEAKLAQVSDEVFGRKTTRNADHDGGVR
jgi:hypothetical protein